MDDGSGAPTDPASLWEEILSFQAPGLGLWSATSTLQNVIVVVPIEATAEPLDLSMGSHIQGMCGAVSARQVHYGKLILHKIM
jgi:hypothetical protein